VRADESLPVYVAAYLGFGEVLQLEDFVTEKIGIAL